jgi:molybdopterin-guanine dinucleotide biosynthesis protein A
MKTTDLFIIAAGKGSRMGGNVPKALVPITDDPCLTTTLQQVGHKFNRVFIVSNRLIQEPWDDYFASVDNKYPNLCYNIQNIQIDSGLGDGHAVMAALNHPDAVNALNDIVVCWGDVFFPQAEIIDQLLSYANASSGLIPAINENNPYVSLLVDEQLYCKSADFSKYGETHPSGFHDQSVFRLNRQVIMNALNTLHSAYWKNGRYITPGGELSLLHTFHYLYNTGNPLKVFESDYQTLSFNTLDEVLQIQQELSAKWKSAQF